MADPNDNQNAENQGTGEGEQTAQPLTEAEIQKLQTKADNFDEIAGRAAQFNQSPKDYIDFLEEEVYNSSQQKPTGEQTQQQQQQQQTQKPEQQQQAGQPTENETAMMETIKQQNMQLAKQFVQTQFNSYEISQFTKTKDNQNDFSKADLDKVIFSEQSKDIGRRAEKSGQTVYDVAAFILKQDRDFADAVKKGQQTQKNLENTKGSAQITSGTSIPEHSGGGGAGGESDDPAVKLKNHIMPVAGGYTPE